MFTNNNFVKRTFFRRDIIRELSNLNIENPDFEFLVHVRLRDLLNHTNLSPRIFEILLHRTLFILRNSSGEVKYLRLQCLFINFVRNDKKSRSP